MKTDRLNYDLPAELIAQQPGAVRSESRLLVLDRKSGQITDSTFNCIGDYLKSGDCLVINDTKVLQARFFARRKTGAKLEGLFLEQKQDWIWVVMLKGAGKVKVGESLSEPLEQSGRFPQLLVQIVSVGEQTGKLDELLFIAADTFDGDADAAITRFMAIMPAVLVLLLAVVIGFIIVATLLPIVSLQLGVQGF